MWLFEDSNVLDDRPCADIHTDMHEHQGGKLDWRRKSRSQATSLRQA